MGQVALQARAPQPDIAAIERAAQGARARDFELQNAPQRSALEALKLQDEIGGQSALAGYRKAKLAGEPDALDKLGAYPKIQKDMYDAFDGMEPEEFIYAKKKSRAFGRAAQYVLSLQKGSPEQKQAWDEALQVLREEGFIDDRQYKGLVQSGPSDLILQQALTVDDYLKEYAGRNSKTNDLEYERLKREKIQAEIDKLKTGGTGTGLGGDATRRNSRLIAANRELAEWAKDNVADAKQIAEKKAEIWSRYDLDPGKAAPGMTESGDGKGDNEVPSEPDAAIPQGAIDYLLEHPDLQAELDAKYGEGAAESILGGQ